MNQTPATTRSLRFALNGIVLRLFFTEGEARNTAKLCGHEPSELRDLGAQLEKVGLGWVYRHDGKWFDANGELEAGIIPDAVRT